jgi:hypothetical protein
MTLWILQLWPCTKAGGVLGMSLQQTIRTAQPLNNGLAKELQFATPHLSLTIEMTSIKSTSSYLIWLQFTMFHPIPSIPSSFPLIGRAVPRQDISFLIVLSPQ